MAQEEEKEVEAQEESEEESQAENAEEEVEPPPMELPPVNFESFVFNLYRMALFHMGFNDPETGKLMQNLPASRHAIDTLIMLQEKTKGNLTAPEGNLMENLLYELRMNYLRAAKQAEEAPEEEPETAEEATEAAEAEEAQEGTE
jgi:uncharacterized protein DUF1844